MTHADHHAVLGTVTGQRMIRIMFRTQGDIFNPSSGRRLILLKLFHRWLGDGFRRLGTYRSTGYKCGAWRDVAWFEKPIAPYDQNPEPIRPVGDIPAEALAAILKRYEAEQP